jgi:cbb3-type cytochrome oxidase subunit 1
MLGGVLFLAGALMMAFNFFMTVRLAAPGRREAALPGGVAVAGE